MMNDLDKYTDLKLLLMSWNVLELFSHFYDEGINIEELQMLKHHHINLLLANFNLGLRIRFEHNFENWRHSLNMPIQCTTAKCLNCAFALPTARLRSSTINASQNAFVNIPTSSSSLCETFASITTISPSTAHGISEASVSTAQQQQQQQLPLKDNCVMPSTAPMTILHSPIILLDEHEDDDIDASTPSVLKILQEWNLDGQHILNYYEMHKNLLPEHRLQMINLIVDYFRCKNRHMSLNMSHNLEDEILKIFPTEKLEFYRINKRGKLYIKYSNSKRYYKRSSRDKRKSNVVNYFSRAKKKTMSSNHTESQLMDEDIKTESCTED